MHLSPHFTLEELTHSNTAVRLGIDNTPPESLLPNLVRLANGLEYIRELLDGVPIHVNSGYRCEELERILTSKDFGAWCVRHGRRRNEESWQVYFAGKAHPKGLSADWTAPAYGSPLKIVRFLARTDLQFDQLIMEGGANGWVHSSFDPRMRHNVLTATFTNGVPTYSTGT